MSKKAKKVKPPAPVPGLLTVLALPSELLRAACGEALPVHTLTGELVELRIPTPEEYKTICEEAWERLLRHHDIRVPMPTDAEIERVTMPLSRTGR